MRIVRIVAVVCLFFGGIAAEAVDLWSATMAPAPIVIAPDASEPVRFAAAELAQWLGRATGAVWPVVHAPEAGKKAIFVGDSSWVRERGFDPETLQPDGAWIKAAPDYLAIAGRDYPGGPLPGLIHPQRVQEVWNETLRLNAFGEMGTLNGVCRFLEQNVGIRWYMTGELGTVVPDLTALTVPDGTTTVAPDFEYRYAWFCDFPEAPEDALWYRRVGFGAPEPVSITHNFVGMLKYQDSHPEYFALIDGKRDFSNLSVMVGGGNLCLSNDALVQQWIDDICAYFAAHPEQELYPLCPMDGMFRICDCPACQAQLSPQLGESGKFSNYVWKFADRVARGVATRCPGKKVGTFAYEHYREVPDNLTELSPNLAVMICYTRQELRDPEQKAKTRDLIERWSKLTPSLYFWTYPIFDYWLPWRGFPLLYPEILAEDIRANRALGARGEFLESEFRMPNGQQVSFQHIAYPGLSHLTAYLTVKLLWDADTDVEALLEEYYRLFYGPAAPGMKQFWERARALTLAKVADHPVKQYTPADIQELFRLLDAAQALCPADSVYARRIGLIRDEMAPFAKRLLNLTESKRALRVPLLKTPLPLSADLLHSAWQDGARYKLTGKDGAPVDFTTYVLAAADAEGIGFTFICFEPEMAKLTANTTERDTGNVWDDDSVEILLCRADGADGRIFIVSAAGNLFDGSWAAADAPTDARWNGTPEIGVRRLADRWIAQVKIPWRDLGATPETASELRVNLYRNRVVGGPTRFAAFTPTMMHQHRVPDFFGPVQLVQP